MESMIQTRYIPWTQFTPQFKCVMGHEYKTNKGDPANIQFSELFNKYSVSETGHIKDHGDRPGPVGKRCVSAVTSLLVG